MKKVIVLILIILVRVQFVVADEGMWLMMLLNKNIETMQKMGLKLSAEDIYSVNKSSLKDAIIQFGRGCTGEIISSEGLILTNHHCGYGSIQAQSTVEHDYLTNGFWAMNHQEELPNPGLTARFLIRMEDVSSRILGLVNKDMDETKRTEIIDREIKKITSEVTKGTDYEASVKPFFDGNAYYMFVYIVYKDVRLVGAPPSSIGKFGADTDNWMWPRHTSDFSLFRIYMSPDGKPAEYSKDNVPFKPKHHLPISLKGVKKDDFVMIMGYPGTTDRFLTSYGVQNAINLKNPTIVQIRNRKLEIMRESMNANPAIRIQYASKYAQTANYWKYYIGQTQQLQNNKVFDKKSVIEEKFKTWVNANNERKAKYGECLTNIADAYKHMDKFEVARWYYVEGVVRGPEIILFAYRYNRLVTLLKDPKADAAKIKEMADTYKSQLDEFFKNYNVGIDQKMMAEFIVMFNKNVDKEQIPKVIKDVVKSGKNDMPKYINSLFAKSIFTDKAKLEKALGNPTLKTFENDPLYKICFDMVESWNTFLDLYNQKEADLKKGMRLFVAGLLEMNPDANYAPNANSTMRLTYGTVQDYSPRDGVHYNYFTTYKGVLEKEDPNNWEFVVPKKQKELMLKKDFGQYAPYGELHTCFISNNDITGGNSGSPVINGEGQLVGLAFDGNWEAMSGDISFEPKLQRTISVDILYVLYVIDKYAGATNIINELTLVR